MVLAGCNLKCPFPGAHSPFPDLWPFVDEARGITVSQFRMPLRRSSRMTASNVIIKNPFRGGRHGTWKFSLKGFFELRKRHETYGEVQIQRASVSQGWSRES